MKKTVRLEIVHDKDTGLTVNYFTWIDGGRHLATAEIANRYVFDGSFNPRHMMAWNAEIDGAIAEFRRQSLERSLG